MAGGLDKAEAILVALREGYVTHLVIDQGTATSLNDILSTQFKFIFTLSDFASAFVQSAFYGGYFLIAIPAFRVMKSYSYKLSILIGLALYIVGCTLVLSGGRHRPRHL